MGFRSRLSSGKLILCLAILTYRINRLCKVLGTLSELLENIPFAMETSGITSLERH